MDLLTNQDEGTTFFPNVWNYSPNGAASHPRRQDSCKPSHSQNLLSNARTRKLGKTVVAAWAIYSGSKLRQITERLGSQTSLPPEYTCVVLQVKMSYQLWKWFRDDVVSIPFSNDRSICRILTPCLLYTTKATREGHTSCWSWRCTIDTRVFVSISADRQPAPPRRAGYRRQVKVTRSI